MALVKGGGAVSPSKIQNGNSSVETPTANGVITFSVNGSQVGSFALNGLLQLEGTTAATNYGLAIKNNSNGDAIVHYEINGGGQWAHGIDNSDNDTWKLSHSSTDVATNPTLTATTGSRVGVRVSEPLSTLHVQTSTGVNVGPAVAADDLVIENFPSPGMSFLAGNLGSACIAFGRSNNNTAGTLEYLHITEGFRFRVLGSEIIRINSTGLGVGTNDPQGRAHIRTGLGSSATASANANDLIIESPTSTGVSLLATDSNDSNVYFGSPSSAIGAILRWNYNANIYTIGTSKSGADVRIMSGNEGEALRAMSDQRIAIGTTSPSLSALVDMTSTTRGMLPPRMTEAQRDAIASPATGLVIYNTDANVLDWYNGASWRSLRERH